VANIVGILIILVVVAGLRVKNFSSDRFEPDESLTEAVAVLEQSRATAQSMQADVFKAADQLKSLQAEAARRQRERDRLATAVAAWEYKLKTRRGTLDEASQKRFDLQATLAETRIQLDRLEWQRSQVEAAPSQPILIESYPTPLSETVDDNEAHFQLRQGRLVYIPLEELLRQFKSDAQRKLDKLYQLPEMTETIGPEGGFRLRYTMQRKSLSGELASVVGMAGSYAQLSQWTLIPTSDYLGEPVEEALLQGSKFLDVVSRYRPESTIITVWTYPDSFSGFRRLKKELYRSGYHVAARPLPHGVPIGGSPQGTKSAAQ
jgi:hypothetical protein